MQATIDATRPTWRACFRDLKVQVPNGVEYCHCTLDMELRPIRGPFEHYQIFWCASGRPQSERRYTLMSGKEAVRKLFREQVTPWQPVTVTIGEPLRTESTDKPPGR